MSTPAEKVRAQDAVFSLMLDAPRKSPLFAAGRHLITGGELQWLLKLDEARRVAAAQPPQEQPTAAQMEAWVGEATEAWANVSPSAKAKLLASPSDCFALGYVSARQIASLREKRAWKS